MREEKRHIFVEHHTLERRETLLLRSLAPDKATGFCRAFSQT